MVERRRVKPPGGGFLYEPMSIPPEWRTWLSKMRSEPPSADELARWAAHGHVALLQGVHAWAARHATQECTSVARVGLKKHVH